MRVYDPCSGSGGMLILSAEYVREHGGSPRDLGVYGQEDNGGACSISSMPARTVDAAERRHEVGAGHGEALARGAWPRRSISGVAVVGIRSHA